MNIYVNTIKNNNDNNNIYQLHAAAIKAYAMLSKNKYKNFVATKRTRIVNKWNKH